MADVGGRIETSNSVYNAKSAFMDIQSGQGHTQHHSGSGSPDAVTGGSGFGSPTSGTPSSSYHHQVRSSPPPVAGYHHHMHGPSPHHHHQQPQIDVPAAGFMSSNPSVQVTLLQSQNSVVFHVISIFTARRYALRGLSYHNSVRLSVTRGLCPHGLTYDHDFFTLW